MDARKPAQSVLPGGEYDFRRLNETADAKIRGCAQWFVVVVVHENGAAACIDSAINVPPAIAYHPALREINVQLLRGS